MVGVGMVVVFGLLNAIGVEIFGKVEVVLTFGMWSTLTIFGLCGIFMAPVTHLRLVRHAAECQRSFRSVRLYRHGDVYVRRL